MMAPFMMVSGTSDKPMGKEYSLTLLVKYTMAVGSLGRPMARENLGISLELFIRGSGLLINNMGKA